MNTTSSTSIKAKIALLPSRKAEHSAHTTHQPAKPAWGAAPPPTKQGAASASGAHTAPTPPPAIATTEVAPETVVVVVKPTPTTLPTPAPTPAPAPATPSQLPPPPFSVDGSVEGSAEAQAVGSFDDMGLREELLRGVYGMGYEKPSPIQARAIVPLARGRSVVVQAPAGTGKTAAFAVGVLQRVDAGLRAVQVLILSPTRELAQQTADVVGALSKHMKISCALCIGGTPVRAAADAVRAGPAVVVGTPGRLCDLLERGALSLRDLRAVVLDEADEMLSRGFAEQVGSIMDRVPEAAALAVVSATFPPGALAMAGRLAAASRPGLVRITLAEEALDPHTVRQFFVECEARHKLGVLLDLTTAAPIASMIVFANSRAASERLATALEKDNFSVALLHADMDASARSEAVARFRRGACRVLVATNVIARGLDVQHVSLVVNYEMAHSSETYLHRIGRCGRRGRQGLAITLLSDESEHQALESAAARFGCTIDALPSNFAQLLR